MKDNDYFPSGLHSSSWKSRAQALETLGILSNDVDYLFPLLFASLYDQEPNVVMLAVHFLEKKIPSKVIIDHLQGLFLAEERQIRFSAVIASEALAENYLVPMLKNLDEKDPEIRQRINKLVSVIESYL